MLVRSLLLLLPVLAAALPRGNGNDQGENNNDQGNNNNHQGNNNNHHGNNGNHNGNKPTTTLPQPNPAHATAVPFNGKTFVNKGLVAIGAIAGDAVDDHGETIGGIGSAIALEYLKRINSTSYSGRMIVQPDRGYNRPDTNDYVARQHYLDFTLTPYYAGDKLEYQAAKASFNLRYASSLLYTEDNRGRTPTTGLDALAVRNGDPPVPIANATYNRISTDAEGLVLNRDGSFWVSDEYGPYIYKYSKKGKLDQVLQPPAAVLPRLNGSLYFTANGAVAPTQGRVPNQGFEGLTASADGKKLYALLQTSTLQDQADDKGRYTRLFEWDVSRPNRTPVLTHAYVVELPVTNGKGKTLGQSDFHYISDDTFVMLARDGKGGGDSDPEAKNKRFYLFTTAGATDIANTPYTDGYEPVAPKNVLLPSIKAATVTPWVDLLDDAQLARFGMHNGSTDKTRNVALVNSKWESIAFASCDDPAHPHDYFLFTFSDNDFIGLKGFQAGKPFADDEFGYTLDNQALVFRVTVPYPLKDA